MPKRKGNTEDSPAEREAFAAGLLYIPEKGIALVREEHEGRTGLVLPYHRVEKSGPNRPEVARLAVLVATGYRSKARFHLSGLVRENVQMTLFLMDGAELDDSVTPSENLTFVPITAEEPIDPDILLYPDDAPIIDYQRAFLLGSHVVSVGTRRAA